MDELCPLCNGMVTLEKTCPHCGGVMVDGGTVMNYAGPYSPYMETIFAEEDNMEYCIHLLYCPNCHYDYRQAYALVTV